MGVAGHAEQFGQECFLVLVLGEKVVISVFRESFTADDTQFHGFFLGQGVGYGSNHFHVRDASILEEKNQAVFRTYITAISFLVFLLDGPDILHLLNHEGRAGVFFLVEFHGLHDAPVNQNAQNDGYGNQTCLESESCVIIHVVFYFFRAANVKKFFMRAKDRQKKLPFKKNPVKNSGVLRIFALSLSLPGVFSVFSDRICPEGAGLGDEEWKS